MSNPLYQQMAGVKSGNNFIQMVQQYQHFKSQFQGNPQQLVQQMLNSRKMSQEQFNKLAQMANQLYPHLR